MNRLAARVLGALLAVALLAVLAIDIGTVVTRGGSGLRITAYFTASNGIYPGNHVDILGLPVGTVQSVTPEPSRVKVVLSLPSGTKVPLGAQAFIVPPSVISDRYVGLSPAYRGGPTMPDGYTIPVARTHVPAEFDDLVGSLTTLFNALGPGSANAKGAVGRLVHVLAGNLAGNGQKIHDTIEGLAGATSALTSDRGGIATVIRKLDTLSRNLAARDALIGAFNSDLAGASSQLAAQRTTITQVLTNLSHGLVQVAAFIRNHRAELHGTLANLVSTTTTLLRHQRALIETLDNLPLAIQNIGRVDHDHRVIVELGQLGQNSTVHDVLTKVCKALPAVCQALSPQARPATHPSTGIGRLFRGAR